MKRKVLLICRFCLVACLSQLPFLVVSQDLASTYPTRPESKPAAVTAGVMAAEIKGKVTSATGEPISGVTVLLKG